MRKQGVTILVSAICSGLRPYASTFAGVMMPQSRT